MTATLNAPTTPDEFTDQIFTEYDTPEAFATAFADDSEKGFKAKFQKYVATSFESEQWKGIRAQLEEQRQLVLHEMMDRGEVPAAYRQDITAHAAAMQRARTEKARMAVARGIEDGVYYNDEAPGAVLDGKFKSKSEYFKAAIDQLRLDQESIAKHKELKAYSEKQFEDGGVLVPEEVRSDILTRSLEMSLVRPKAQVIPMPSGKMKYPAVDFTTEVGEVYGGIVAYWVDEGEEIPETSSKFASITLDTNKLAARAAPPNELVRHAPAFSAWLNQNLPKALTHFEDRDLLKGNGVGKPLGQLHANNPSLITVSKEVGQPAATITWINVLTMVARMLPECLMSADWVATVDSLSEIMTMALPVGTGGSAVMAVDATRGAPMTLFTRPINWSRKAPGVLGTKGDLSITDFSTYVIGDTLTMRIESSQHELFSRDKTVFRVIEELDGRPQLLSALTPENGGPTLSGTVQLETRS